MTAISISHCSIIVMEKFTVEVVFDYKFRFWEWNGCSLPNFPINKWGIVNIIIIRGVW